MTFQEFKHTTQQKNIPENLNIFLQALWHDAQNNWEKAHEIAQLDEGNFKYDRIHAYLHRKEGDLFNAKYWYRKINVPFPDISLSQEWENLVQEYLKMS